MAGSKITAPLNDEIALRIGLAAKQLAIVDTFDLLQLLIRIMGEPITKSKIDKLRAKKIKQEGALLFKDVDHDDFEKAFALLKGRGIRQYINPKPQFISGTYCEIHGSLRVACASNRGESIDGDFGSCIRFLVYQVSPDHIRLIDIREPKAGTDRAEKNQARATLLEDCSLLYTTGIGAHAAAKVVKVGLHPIRLLQSVSALDELAKLQQVLRQENLPPWLAKAMGKPNLGVKLYGEYAS